MASARGGSGRRSAVVVPAAISGIVAAMILAISRAIGETMVVALAAGATAGSLFTLNPLGPGQTLTGAMASLAAGSDQVTGNTAAFQSLFFLGLLLFLMTLGLNILGDAFVRRTRQTLLGRTMTTPSIADRRRRALRPSPAASTSRGLRVRRPPPPGIALLAGDPRRPGRRRSSTRRSRSSPSAGSTS